MPSQRNYLEEKGPRGGLSNKSISLDCRQQRHRMCIYENCDDACHEGQEYVHGHWRKVKEPAS